ncbi:unnamed protein product (macronuclear) [Paramecium tetraurelia]|uniref:Protein kinase domain-containing protein n=1 Tax=Paramecium tetraurelia TaxID=5888 RepID=A0CIP9_PARTE|nr:uncharacterized protein GSPATT00007801001 [Paramecium tetraurelia]CAK70666.1 unnamed protein product [Paramecium tetraurelia]|eukprot:XP_001438063.1 hypothetical protein (macronuclear) [Paramecium tetraurelia strain d4-2]
MQVIYQMICLRKHILKSKTYYLEVHDDQMILSEVMKYKQLSSINTCQMLSMQQNIHGTQGSCGSHLTVKNCVHLEQIIIIELNGLILITIHQIYLKYTYQGKYFLGTFQYFMIQINFQVKEHHLKYVQLNAKRAYHNMQQNVFLRNICYKKNQTIELLQQEIQILQKIDHPSFVKLYEIYQGENSYYIVTDYLEGDTLYNYIKTEAIKVINTYNAIQIILTALNYLASINIIHRDIKLENVLLQKPNDITSLKVIDFGLAIYKYPLQKLSVCGTPGYIAPEILKHADKEEYFTEKCDIFSAGVIFFKLLTKKTLFRAQNTIEIMEKNKICQINFQEFEFKLQKEAINLLKGMLDPNPNTRYSAQQCLDHSYFSCKLENINILQEILDKATGFSGITQIIDQKNTNSIGQECQAAQVKKCNPTSYKVRMELRKRTKSPRKYADFQFYYPSFCQKNSCESLSSKGSSYNGSQFENFINDKLDSVIEEDEKQQIHKQ